MKTDDVVRKYFNPYFKSLLERKKDFREFAYPHYLEIEEYDERRKYNEFILRKLFPNGDEQNLFEAHYPFVLEVMKLDKISFVDRRELITTYHSLKEEEQRYERWISHPIDIEETFGIDSN